MKPHLSRRGGARCRERSVWQDKSLAEDVYRLRSKVEAVLEKVAAAERGEGGGWWLKKGAGDC